MNRIILETQNRKDLQLLLQIAERLNISVAVKDNDAEANERKLTYISMKFSEKSLAQDWDCEDDAYWNSFLKNH